MDFVNKDGQRPTARRSISSGAIVQGDASPEDIARVMNALSTRVAELEAAAAPDAIEFEVDVPANGTVTLEHGFNGPVRYFVTHWKEASVGAAPHA